ncbi:DNA polymerase III subunit gamma/tau [Ureaplasma sp. ES3154-GEN]|uniref:DNA polymerase III subunit gamma/tau n=1 Tax=Ureaplasma sp. ES3154-GEN TaxID=2984844 RepID=UPI0021E7843C|nr:DNA polymerase III subunit gamma/tau [Ureaplasma sp. ES3154-GEN]MCV3743441.1 DNA polymerase III subunit gamma/tau [Ureaplasma sp. ES3154-GEN]
MSNLSLYRLYRPHTFADVIGQEHIKTILMNAVGLNKINHAYIFSGPRGIGKTSIARIFASLINCLDPVNNDCCTKCTNCINLLNDTAVDFVELDAASNNGVEQIRSIIDNVYYLPTNFKKKVYVIDEAHMLTTQAWNAFLKTLEEPPAHVVFVFATTEFHKIPLTIISRSQRFDFQGLNSGQLKTLLLDVAKKENIVIDNLACDLLINLARYSARDMLSLLDQLATFSKKINLDLINRTFNLVGYEEKINFLKLILNKDFAQLKKVLNNFAEQGCDLQTFVYDLLNILFVYKENALAKKYISNDILKENDFEDLKNFENLIDEATNSLINVHSQLKNSLDEQFELLKSFYSLMFPSVRELKEIDKLVGQKQQLRLKINETVEQNSVKSKLLGEQELQSNPIKNLYGSKVSIVQPKVLPKTIFFDFKFSYSDEDINSLGKFKPAQQLKRTKSISPIIDTGEINVASSETKVRTEPLLDSKEIFSNSTTSPATNPLLTELSQPIISQSLEEIEKQNEEYALNTIFNVYKDKTKSISVNEQLKSLKNKWLDPNSELSYSNEELKWLNLVKEIKSIAAVSENGIVCLCNKIILPKIYKAFSNINFITFIYKNLVPNKQYSFLAKATFSELIDVYKKQSYDEKSPIIKDNIIYQWINLYADYQKEGDQIIDLIANLDNEENE